jgi:hypothetical protein
VGANRREVNVADSALAAALQVVGVTVQLFRDELLVREHGMILSSKYFVRQVIESIVGRRKLNVGFEVGMSWLESFSFRS